MIQKRVFLYFLTFLISIISYAQTVVADSANSTKKDEFNTEFHFYTEFYSSVELSDNEQQDRPDYVYSYKRLKSVSPNLTLLKVVHGNSKIRFGAGLMLGDYATFNLAGEKKWARNIFEANAELRLSKKRELWLSAGIFPSHIGMESAIGKTCINLTRSIVADNSPYYETGVKLNYSIANGKWSISALLLNGWQRINSPVDKLQPAIGTQINFTPSKQLTFSYNTFIGNVNQGLRFYNNVYAVYSGKGRISAAISVDYGLQSISDTMWRSCFSPVAIVAYKINETMKSAVRFETYTDPNSAVITSESGFNVTSFSMNYDWNPAPFFTLRLEYKYGNSPLKNFNGESKSSLLTGAMIISVQ